MKPPRNNHPTSDSPDSVLHLAAAFAEVDQSQTHLALQPIWPLLERVVLRRLAKAGLKGQMLEDCGQNVFLRVWQYRSKYRGGSEGEFWQWVCRICDNERKRLIGREVRWWRFARADSEPPARDPEDATDRHEAPGRREAPDRHEAPDSAGPALEPAGEVAEPHVGDGASAASGPVSAGPADRPRLATASGRVRNGLAWEIARSVSGKATAADEAVVDKEAFAALAGCLATLTAQQREVIELLYFPPQLSERAAATLLGCSSSNVHRLKSEAMQRLLVCMKAKGID